MFGKNLAFLHYKLFYKEKIPTVPVLVPQHCYQYPRSLRYRYLLVTWRFEASPPCRRITDTSGNHCGVPVSLILSSFSTLLSFSKLLHQFITVHCSIHCLSLLFVSVFRQFFSSLIFVAALCSGQFFSSPSQLSLLNTVPPCLLPGS